MEFLARHKLVGIIAALLVVAVGWYVLSSSSGAPESSLVAASATSEDNQQLISTLNVLRAVKLDTAVFSNPSFQSLQDYSTPVVPEPVGRPDPFAPLSSAEAVTASTTKSAAIFKARK